MLRHPALVRVLEQQDLRLQPDACDAAAAARDRRRHERRLPRWVGRGAWIVVGKIDDPHRSAALDQHAQRGQQHALLERADRLAGRTVGPVRTAPTSARGGFVFSACGRISAIATVAMPSSSR